MVCSECALRETLTPVIFLYSVGNYIEEDKTYLNSNFFEHETMFSTDVKAIPYSPTGPFAMFGVQRD